jgi:hypothetical protein
VTKGSRHDIVRDRIAGCVGASEPTDSGTLTDTQSVVSRDIVSNH